MGRPLTIAMVAGESSGDSLGAGLIRALRRCAPETRFVGIAGPKMQDAGCRSLYPLERLSVLGLFETFGRYPELLRLRSRLVKQWLSTPPDLFIGIDAPDFNLRLEERLRAGGVKTVHYASPQVWAWRRYRVKKMMRAVDLLLVLFPFELDFYREHNVPVEYIGHPFADDIPMDIDREAAREALQLTGPSGVVALLPGSRRSEVHRLSPVMIDTARWLVARRPDTHFLVPLANPRARAVFEEALSEHPVEARFTLLKGDARSAMAAADAVLLASGTATLEGLLLKRPMVITYRMNRVTYLIADVWLRLNIDHVGLPNLLAGRALVPECLQDDAVAEKLGPPLLRYLEHPSELAGMYEEYREIHRALRCGANARAARAVLGLLDRGVARDAPDRGSR